jgi:cyanophycinase-like exopeptidase
MNDFLLLEGRADFSGRMAGSDQRTNELAGSLCWQAVLEVYQAGAMVGGSSAGAYCLLVSEIK